MSDTVMTNEPDEFDQMYEESEALGDIKDNAVSTTNEKQDQTMQDGGDAQYDMDELTTEAVEESNKLFTHTQAGRSLNVLTTSNSSTSPASKVAESELQTSHDVITHTNDHISEDEAVDMKKQTSEDKIVDTNNQASPETVDHTNNQISSETSSAGIARPTTPIPALNTPGTLTPSTGHLDVSTPYAGTDPTEADKEMDGGRDTEGDRNVEEKKVSENVTMKSDKGAKQEVTQTPAIDMSQVNPSSSTKPEQDHEFLEAAAANKDNPAAEWQFDSSDEDSDSSDSSSDSDSSDDSNDDEEGYEMLDPATTARMLMDEGDDEDGGQQSSAPNKNGLKTKNEQAEEVVPKPDVVVTPDMNVVPLGVVEHTVENFVVIKAYTSGEYQVLESGSVLCLEDRTVIGAVMETMGRVQEPRYTMAFTNKQELKDLGIVENTKVFYIEKHSTFVFTEPLRGLKGTDASNIHDEEVAEDDQEFSDDEKESAWKRYKKRNRQGTRRTFLKEYVPPTDDRDEHHGSGRNARGHGHDPDAETGPERPLIKYDDDDDEDMYTPLTRPSNYADVAPGRGGSDGGRGGRGRGGRGRDSRGRGDRGGRGRGGRQSGHRGDHSGPRGGHRGGHPPPPQGYPQQQYPIPPPGFFSPGSGVPPPPPGWPQSAQHQQSAYGQSPQAYPYGQSSQQSPYGQPAQQPSYAHLSQQSSYGQQPQQYGTPGYPPQLPASIPPGSHVNPAFWGAGQQQHQQSYQSPGQYPNGQAQAGQDQTAALQALMQQLQQNGSNYQQYGGGYQQNGTQR